MLAQTIILTAAVAVIGSNSLVLSPILADVAAGLGTTVVAVSRAIAAYGGATALSAFVLAPRIDHVGPRRRSSAAWRAWSRRPCSAPRRRIGPCCCSRRRWPGSAPV